MLTSLLLAAAFTSLAIPLVPSPRLQQFVLSWSGRGLRLALLSWLLLAFLVSLQPGMSGHLTGLLPDEVTSAAADIDGQLGWLLGSGLLIGLAVPLLALMDFARNRAAETALLQRLLGDLADSVRAITRQLEQELHGESEPRLPPERRQQIRSALEAIQDVTEQAAARAPQKRTLAEFVH